MNILLKALTVSSSAHAGQYRKGTPKIPYINHPIYVAYLLAEYGNISDEEVLAAAILHDTIEDTNITYSDLQVQFGTRIADIVQDCSDDKDLPKEERKLMQIKHASTISPQAKLVKLADKIANLSDISLNPPQKWSIERKVAYLNWSQNVINAGLRGLNPMLEDMFDTLCIKLNEELIGV
jgi:guanosine-3',5'-bis(diphosphate) 3'-pyrophosphohydrolase